MFFISNPSPVCRFLLNMDSKLRNNTLFVNQEIKLKGFKVYETSSNNGGHSYSRKDFYKINITKGKFLFHYADRSIETAQDFLFFGNPRIPYSCEPLSAKFSGYTCVFAEEFLSTNERTAILHQSPLFKIAGTPIFNLTSEQRKTISTFFRKMLLEQHSDYVFKDDLIRNYINLIVHEALKMKPSDPVDTRQNAALRVTSVFLELLERQFPIENSQHPLQLKSAKNFADNLSLHTNYLNSAVKGVTGKSTTALIAERVVSEARSLLQHTDWNISEVAYALGFEYPTYFNNFFKKKTGEVPKSVRSAQL